MTPIVYRVPTLKQEFCQKRFKEDLDMISKRKGSILSEGKGKIRNSSNEYCPRSMCSAMDTLTLWQSEEHGVLRKYQQT